MAYLFIFGRFCEQNRRARHLAHVIQILAKMMELVRILGTETTSVNVQAFMVEITAKRVNLKAFPVCLYILSSPSR